MTGSRVQLDASWGKERGFTGAVRNSFILDGEWSVYIHDHKFVLSWEKRKKKTL